MKQQQPLDLKNYSFLHDFGIKHFLLVNTIIRNSRDQNICLVPSPKYSIDKTRPSSPSPATMTTLVSSHTMSQLHQSSATLTCSVCDRVKIILKKTCPQRRVVLLGDSSTGAPPAVQHCQHTTHAP